MITVSNLGMQFGGQWLFQHVDLQFLPGNCYGIIGANGAGKSTFLRILTGELDSTNGSVTIDPTKRVSVLKQNQNAYDDYTVMDTVIMGNAHLYEVLKEKDAIYEKPDFTDEDGLRAADLEAEFAELGGWEAESDASRLLQGLGIGTELHYEQMASVDPRLKVKILLAQALFGNPDIVMLDEPTNNLDIEAINWLEDFLLDFPGMVIAVSHDRHFLNTVCTHIVDIDYGKIKMYVGNYDFWYESSQLVQSLIRNQNKRNEEKAAILYDFLDQSKFFTGAVRKEDRSLMNVPFVTPSKEQDADVVAASKAAGFDNLKGHKSVGGLRASIYNAMPKEGVEALVEFLKKYEAEHA